MTVFLVFSHKLTEDQIHSLKEEFGITQFQYLPKPLQLRWSAIPPDFILPQILTLCEDIFQTISEGTNGNPSGHYLLAVGDQTATIHMNLMGRDSGMICLQSTTERINEETKLPDGSVKKTVQFKHVKWRKIFG